MLRTSKLSVSFAECSAQKSLIRKLIADKGFEDPGIMLLRAQFSLPERLPLQHDADRI
ncbi:hypothetical protein [Xaviernesmea oryzae]|uniref:hypothetical protein n=1 Tax=Xaviernesmea oryzae TaxID=464029 RepID=UPI000AA0BD6F|nr:hypothetical protein [Xaviernesmea oryzae]